MVSIMSKQIRVTLSGSGFRLPAHVGALAAVEEMGYEIVEMSGTSGGSIVSALYACGHNAANLRDVTLVTDFEDMLEFNIPALFSFSYCSGDSLLRYLQTLIGKNTRFKDLKIPLHVVASDISVSQEYVFDKPDENVAIAVRASTAVPILYAPVRIGKSWLVDGGVCSNTPVELLKDDDILKLGVRLIADVDTTPIDSVKDILVRTADLLFESNDRIHIEAERRHSAIFSFINTGTVGSFDTRMSPEVRQHLYELGYEGTKKVLMDYEQSR